MSGIIDRGAYSSEYMYVQTICVRRIGYLHVDVWCLSSGYQYSRGLVLTVDQSRATKECLIHLHMRLILLHALVGQCNTQKYVLN